MGDNAARRRTVQGRCATNPRFAPRGFWVPRPVCTVGPSQKLRAYNLAARAKITPSTLAKPGDWFILPNSYRFIYARLQNPWKKISQDIIPL